MVIGYGDVPLTMPRGILFVLACCGVGVCRWRCFCFLPPMSLGWSCVRPLFIALVGKKAVGEGARDHAGVSRRKI